MGGNFEYGSQLGLFYRSGPTRVSGRWFLKSQKMAKVDLRLNGEVKGVGGELTHTLVWFGLVLLTFYASHTRRFHKS